MLEWEQDAGIATMWLDRPPVNALDGDFLQEIATTVRVIEAADVGALIVSGRGSCFSAGADLFQVLQASPEDIDASVQGLIDAFGALFTFRRPMIAAVNGHAIAGGCIIACAADHRVMARDSGVIGVSELRVGVPFPTYALEIMRFAAAPHRFNELVLFGRNYKPEDAIALGLIDEVVEPDELTSVGRRAAERLAAIPNASFETVKRLIRAPTVERVERYAKEIDPIVLEGWKTPEVAASIRAFLEKTVGTKP